QGAAAGRAASLPQGVAAARGAAVDAKTGLPTRVVHRASGVTLVLIPAGEFVMGSADSEEGRTDEERRHRRVVRSPFYLGETEVTVAQFRRFVRAARYLTDAERGTPDGGHARGAFSAVAGGDREWNRRASWRNAFPNFRDYRPRESHPVVHVSWNDARRFASHYGLSLPTEAQWEYAHRAGGAARFPWGDREADGAGRGNVADASGARRFPSWNMLFTFDDGAALVAAAGSYRANAWGLRDMTGNVQEWCEDAYLADYPADGADESAARARTDDVDAQRVLRGGSWLDGPQQTRSAARAAMRPSARRDFIGFRVALRLGLRR
ncbi:MAG TPA: SUMF1/EgtB/PvdO family nonheme iron enzyme, partial [Pyrinomonadaceae bacterium]|nr:SUMF1/EgtB/PvdO family nonheme iron enzyme [Pyrinomonadaceae bacterium]